MTAVPWILGALALVVGAGWISPLARTLVGALACFAGVAVAFVGVMSNPIEVGHTFGGSALMATGSMAMAMASFRRWVLVLLLLMVGIPFGLVFWMSAQLGAANAATAPAAALKWVALGVVVSLGAFAMELAAGRGRPTRPDRGSP